MNPDGCTIRTMTRDEVDLAVDWAAAEGWNPGVADADCFHKADPSGFLIGLLHGEPVASISVIRYGDSYGFLGFYIVRPEYRGKGLGLAIWKAGLKLLSGRVVGLDGVVDQQDNYRKSGFTLAYRNVRRRGVGGCPPPDATGLKDLSCLSFQQVVEYDRPFFPDDRAGFLECWTRMEGTRALGLVEDGRLAGYGVRRTCREGHKIGPLFADDADKALALFQGLRQDLGPNEPFCLDTPEANPEAVALADAHDMDTVFETARMYKGPVPDLPVYRTFGVTSFELG